MTAQKIKQFKLAMVGATGAVGNEVLHTLSSREFPLEELRPLASKRSVGKTVQFGNQEIAVQELTEKSFQGMDIAFFSAGATISREFAPLAVKAGALVIDNSSAFRMEKDVPLAVPEVNPETIEKRPERGIISVPNCATIQMVVALAPLHRKAGIKRVIMSSYQSTSGAGRRAMDELSNQVKDLFNYRELTSEVLPHRIAFNLIPQIDVFQKDGTTGEEAKIIQETKKILSAPEMGVSATAVRVPTFHGHAESINIETEKELTPEEARELLAESKGIVLMDDEKDRRYPVLMDAVGNDDVYVGRIRKDASRENCLNLWVVADNLRKGAALNGIQILEHMIQKGAM